MHDEKNHRFIEGNEIIELTPKENELLALLLKNKGKLVSYEEISKIIYKEIPNYILYNCIKMLVTRLRKKIGKEYIETRRSIGYIIK